MASPGPARLERLREAMAHLDRAEAVGSQDPRIPLVRARTHLAAREDDRAREVLSGMIATPEVRLEVARLLLRQGRAPEALQQLHGVAGPEAELLRTQCEPPDQRLQAVRAAEARHPDHPGFARLEASLLSARGLTSEAATLLEQALRSHREDAGLLRQLVHLLHRCNRHADSLVHLRTWTRLLPDDPEAKLLLGRVHAAQGRPAEARKAILEHLQLQPEAHDVRLELARLLLNDSGRPEEALPLLDMLDRQPGWQGRVTPLRGLVLARCGRFQDAEQVLRPIVQSTQDADLVAQYAHVVASLGHAETARKWARRALDLDGSCHKARELLQLSSSP